MAVRTAASSPPKSVSDLSLTVDQDCQRDGLAFEGPGDFAVLK
jgi:hypothetical protein